MSPCRSAPCQHRCLGRFDTNSSFCATRLTYSLSHSTSHATEHQAYRYSTCTPYMHCVPAAGAQGTHLSAHLGWSKRHLHNAKRQLSPDWLVRSQFAVAHDTASCSQVCRLNTWLASNAWYILRPTVRKRWTTCLPGDTVHDHVITITTQIHCDVMGYRVPCLRIQVDSCDVGRRSMW